jgi:hypothetical protein
MNRPRFHLIPMHYRTECITNTQIVLCKFRKYAIIYAVGAIQ